jgi:alkylresorcinol/alkylpyrone synthase
MRDMTYAPRTLPLPPTPETVRDGPRVAAVATAVPDVEVGQADVERFAARWLEGVFDGQFQRLLGVFAHSGVETRRMCMPITWYESEHSFAETSALYVEHATALAVRASLAALARAGLSPAEVDHVVVVSSTGVTAPSLDARLANAIGLREDVRRTPVWGLGCAGGASGLALARDLALARPSARVLLVAVELCSFAYQRGDRDRRNLVAASLFADGAAATVVLGREALARSRAAGNGHGDNGHAAAAPRLALVASSSTTWKDTLDVMGWTVDGDGLHVVFSRDIPEIVRERLHPAVEAFLAREGLPLERVRHVVAHPGGPKVLDALARTLGTPTDTLDHAYEVLRTRGNMSAPTCLFVLERALAAGDFRRGDWGLVLALGPGFSLEQVLVHAV